MIDHVVEGLACQGHVQAGHVCEIGRTQTAGMMGLREEHLLGRPGGRSPLTKTTLQRPQLTVGEPTRVALLEPGEQGVGLQPGTELQLLSHLLPDVRERILTRPPCSWPLLQLTG